MSTRILICENGKKLVVKDEDISEVDFETVSGLFLNRNEIRENLKKIENDNTKTKKL